MIAMPGCRCQLTRILINGLATESAPTSVRSPAHIPAEGNTLWFLRSEVALPSLHWLPIDGGSLWSALAQIIQISGFSWKWLVVAYRKISNQPRRVASPVPVTPSWNFGSPACWTGSRALVRDDAIHGATCSEQDSSA
jgi:hypothetical protein